MAHTSEVGPIPECVVVIWRQIDCDAYGLARRCGRRRCTFPCGASWHVNSLPAGTHTGGSMVHVIDHSLLNCGSQYLRSSVVQGFSRSAISYRPSGHVTSFLDSWPPALGSMSRGCDRDRPAGVPGPEGGARQLRGLGNLLGNPFGNPPAVPGPDSAALAGPRTAPDLVERHPTTPDGPVGSAYGSEGWGFESLRAR